MVQDSQDENKDLSLFQVEYIFSISIALTNKEVMCLV